MFKYQQKIKFCVENSFKNLKRLSMAKTLAKM